MALADVNKILCANNSQMLWMGFVNTLLLSTSRISVVNTTPKEADES